MDLLVIIFLILIIALPTIQVWLKYNESSYRVFSKNSFKDTAFNKGNLGEFYTFYELEKLDRRNKLLTNIYLQREDGSTTEIDLIMISTKGIFVFESKNYGGWVYGSEKNKYWTQTFSNKSRNKFFNPIWQNKAHIRALSKVLDYDDLNIYKSYIVFSEQCTLKSITNTSINVRVLNRNKLLEYLKRDLENSKDVFDEKKTQLLFQILLEKRVRGADTKDKHIQQVESIKARSGN